MIAIARLSDFLFRGFILFEKEKGKENDKFIQQQNIQQLQRGTLKESTFGFKLNEMNKRHLILFRTLDSVRCSEFRARYRADYISLKHI